MKRGILNLLAVISLVPCLANAGLWAFSYFSGGRSSQRYVHSGRFNVAVGHGSIHAESYPSLPARPKVHYWQTMLFTLLYGTIANRWFFYTLMPLWMPTALFAAFPIIRLAQRYRTLPTAGLCASCGYDLRATPDRCPECGAVPDAVPSRPARRKTHA